MARIRPIQVVGVLEVEIHSNAAFSTLQSITVISRHKNSKAVFYLRAATTVPDMGSHSQRLLRGGSLFLAQGHRRSQDFVSGGDDLF